MRTLFYTLIVVTLLQSCQHNSLSSDARIKASSQRLLQVSASKTTDTLLLRRVLDSAFVVANQYVSRQHDSLYAVLSRVLGNQLLLTKGAEAREVYKRGLSIGLRQLSPNEDIITRLYRNTALTYFSANDYKTALVYFDSVKITNQDTLSQIMKIQTFVDIAKCYQQNNDNKSAVNMMEKTEPLAIKYYGKTDLAKYLGRYSSCLRTSKKYREARDKGLQSLDVIKLLQKEKVFTSNDSLMLADAHYYIAYALHDSGAYKAAEPDYLRAMSIYKEQKSWRDYYRGISNVGFLYRFDKQFDKAEKVLTEGIDLLKKPDLDDLTLRIKASFFVNRSEVYLDTKQYQKAIADHDSAIYLFTLYDKKPSLTAIMLQARPVLLSVYADKAKALIALSEKGQNTEGYQQALNLFDKIVDLSSDIQADYISDDAKLTLADNIKPAFEKAIELCQSLYQKTHDNRYLQQAFAFAEHSRSRILSENSRLNNQLPQALQADNADLKRREAALIQNNNTDDLQDYLRLKRQFREKIKAFNRNQIADVKTIQQTLLAQNKTALIEYFVGDSAVFVFTVTHDSLSIQKVSNAKNLEATVLALRNAVLASDNPTFRAKSGQLYQQILPTWVQVSSTADTIDRLIVIPDGVLSYLSFDMLVSPFVSEPKDETIKELPFLIKKYTIGYAPSANFLIEEKHKPNKSTASKTFMGFAPQYKSKDTAADVVPMRSALTREGAYALPQAREEVEQIHAIVGGEVFINEKADEKTFKTNAPKARILHLAMHALTDDNNPSDSRLLLTLNGNDAGCDNDLTVAELNTLSLNADLAVLSACNTGFGKINKGEGVMSIARAFHYAGVSSTVMSLWKVPDTETSAIMVDFYHNLKAGLPKDVALRKAKIAYLTQVRMDNKAAPLYWSAFVLSGSTDPLVFAPPLSNLWILGISVLILSVVVGLYRFQL